MIFNKGVRGLISESNLQIASKVGITWENVKDFQNHDLSGLEKTRLEGYIQRISEGDDVDWSSEVRRLRRHHFLCKKRHKNLDDIIQELI
jgi:hypothetical protein